MPQNAIFCSMSMLSFFFSGVCPWLILFSSDYFQEMTDAITPFESSDQAADMYRKDKPHLFIEFAKDHYLLQGISNGEHSCLLSCVEFLYIKQNSLFIPLQMLTRLC
jgi:hypothetical protein